MYCEIIDYYCLVAKPRLDKEEVGEMKLFYKRYRKGIQQLCAVREFQ
jgi:hypothetical protein